MPTPTPPDLDKQLAQWRQEQDKVAAQVVVLDDPPPPPSPSSSDDTVIGSRHRYKIVPQNAQTTNEHLYGGVDVSFPESQTDPAVAVYVILRNNEVIYEDHIHFTLQVPYVSSYLSFREIGPLERLVTKQRRTRPELTPRAILVDGNGVLHVRRAGIACFLGVRTGVPTIGVGKKLYCCGGLTHGLVGRGIRDGMGEFWRWCRDNPVDKRRLMAAADRGLVMDQECIDAGVSMADVDAEGSSTCAAHSDDLDMTELVDNAASVCSGYAVKLRGTDGTVWGAALLCHGGKVYPRGRPTQKAIFVSVGHSISLEEAVRICSKLSIARIPEPIRAADLRGRQLMRDESGGGS